MGASPTLFGPSSQYNAINSTALVFPVIRDERSLLRCLATSDVVSKDSD